MEICIIINKRSPDTFSKGKKLLGWAIWYNTFGINGEIKQQCQTSFGYNFIELNFGPKMACVLYGTQ